MQTTLSPKSKQRQSKTRTVRLTQTAGGAALVLHQRQGNLTTVDAYFLKSIPCELGGRGLQLTKHDGEVYHVRFDGTASTCDCRGFTRWNHCKHVEALLTLEAAGKLS